MKNETDLLLIKKIFLSAGFGISSTKGDNFRQVIRFNFINDSTGRPLSIWPSNLRDANFLASCLGGSHRSKILSKVAFSFGLGKMFSHGLVNLYADQRVVEQIKQQWGKSYVISVNGDIASIYHGTKENDARFTTRIALTEDGKAMLCKEGSVLKQLSDLEFRSFGYSKILSATDSTMLIESNLPIDVKRINTEFSHEHRQAIVELYKNRVDNKQIKSLDVFKKASLSLTALTCSEDNRLPQNLINKLAYLKSSIDQEKTVFCGPSHGKFTYENVTKLDGRMAIDDWRNYSSNALLFTDLFDFVLYSNIVERKRTAAEVLRQIDRLAEEDWIISLCGSDADFYLHFRLYLLVSLTNQLEKCVQAKTWGQDSFRFIKVWSELLTIVLSKTKLLNQRQLLTMDLFCYLRSRRYAALKWDTDFPEELSLLSDLEIAIEKKDLEGVERFLFMHPFASQIERKPLSNKNSYSIETGDGLQLGIDVTWKFMHKGIVFVDAPTLLASAHLSNGGVKIPDVIMDFAYTWLSFILNNQSVPEELQDKFMRLDARERDRLNGYFTKEWRATGILHYAFAMDQLADLTRSTTLALKGRKQNSGVAGFVNKLLAGYDGLLQFSFKEPTPVVFSSKAKANKYITSEQLSLRGGSNPLNGGYIRKSA